MTRPFFPHAAWPGARRPPGGACGMGFVAQPGLPASGRIVALGLEALAALTHRGGMDADGESGDGAGLLIQVPRRLLGDHGVVVLFDWDGGGRRLVEESVTELGMELAGWRQVPTAPEALGDRARRVMPAIWQGLVRRPDLPDGAWEGRLLRARRRAEQLAEAAGVRLYIPSASCRTVVYKAMTTGDHLAAFYPDLTTQECESQLAVFHQRYATNTMPDWRLAQPFRLLAHNGEINSWAGNRDWMRAREAELEEVLKPVIWGEGSDSASLDNAIELLTDRGFDPAEAIMALVPDAWEGRGDLDPAVRDFYRYQSSRFEPWDGPAALAFSDGLLAGVALDRNGLRPMRYQVTADGLVVAASEAGVIRADPAADPANVVERGRLGPGQMLLADTRDGRILRDQEAKAWVAGRHDYGSLADGLTALVDRRHREVVHELPTSRLQVLFGWGTEEVKIVLRSMVETGAEPVYSMGDDTPVAPLGSTPRRVYGRLRQRFAQVTNPAIDSLRERSVMSLRTLLGARARTLGGPGDPRLAAPAGAPISWAGRESRRPLLELASPVLGAAEAARVLRTATVLDATLAPGESLGQALARLCRESEAAAQGILVLSDMGASCQRPPVPMALAVGAVHRHLIESGQRTQKDLVAFAGDVVEVHDLAMLITIGASAVHPHLALATAMEMGESRDEAEDACRRAFDHGLLKVMAKMGVSTVASYTGGQVLEAIGLGAQVMELCLPGVASRIGGASLDDLETEIRARQAEAEEDLALPDHGRVRFRKAGEWHAHNPLAVRALQRAAASGTQEDWQAYRELARRAPAALRDLFQIRPGTPVPLEEVEPASAIVARFVSTAMSLGSLSPEAHGALTAAMRGVGGRSNSGEGGEDPDLYRGPGLLDSAIKQVASARFGVTRQYLERAQEIEIKIAQGSKPGEGGQLPGAKVTPLIARLRHAQPGMQLISPPPHHDIYSIEDLAQLIHDLHAANPSARVGVKLVAESGVGTIAVGVAKAGADYILISGHEGGTGASPLASIKNAGVPWEIGLSETQQALVASGLRSRVHLRVDGGIRTGRDVMVGALMGAEEFGFGTALLVALGCDMARQCHLNTCPTGIATQREDLRAKFDGRPEAVVNYLTLVAEEVRRLLASLGARRLEEIVGEVGLLDADPAAASRGLDLSRLLSEPAPGEARRWSPFARRLPAPRPSPPPGPITLSNRSTGADLKGPASYRGSAGQSFGAWCADGVELELEGEANDYVAKGISGGLVSIRAHRGDAAADPVLVGNTCLYGATGGKVFIAGRAGERFCVRNSGALAVVEGAGDHFCEYMTGGAVASLGPVGRNVGAGMTGGIAFVLEWAQLHPQSVTARHLTTEESELLRELVQEHLVRTASTRAAALLADWESALHRFRAVVPILSEAAATSASPGPSPSSLTLPRPA